MNIGLLNEIDEAIKYFNKYDRQNTEAGKKLKGLHKIQLAEKECINTYECFQRAV